MSMGKRGDLKARQRTTRMVEALPRRRQPAMDAGRPHLGKPLSRDIVPPATTPSPITAVTGAITKQLPDATRKPITINLTLPSLKRVNYSVIPAAYRRAVNSSRKTKLIGGAVITITLATLGGYHWMSSSDTITATDPNTVDAKPDLIQGTPEYAVVFPEGKSIKSYEGATWVNPPDRTPVFVYTDSIEGASINVSQQPLPEDFKTDPSAKIAEVAASFKANEKITASNSTIHIGTSDNGAQSVILQKDDLLISMTSKATLETDKWVAYITSLQ